MTKEGLLGLVTKTDCKAWFYAEEDRSDQLIGAHEGLKTLSLPSTEWMLHHEEPKRYPYDKTFEQAARDVIVIIHTSGTTGKRNDTVQGTLLTYL